MATYYIATDGNDSSGDGSTGTPWLTLAKFITASTNNDICMVKDGTYSSIADPIWEDRTITAVNTGLAIFLGEWVG